MMLAILFGSIWMEECPYMKEAFYPHHLDRVGRIGEWRAPTEDGRVALPVRYEIPAMGRLEMHGQMTAGTTELIFQLHTIYKELSLAIKIVYMSPERMAEKQIMNPVDEPFHMQLPYLAAMSFVQYEIPHYFFLRVTILQDRVHVFYKEEGTYMAKVRTLPHSTRNCTAVEDYATVSVEGYGEVYGLDAYNFNVDYVPEG